MSTKTMIKEVKVKLPRLPVVNNVFFFWRVTCVDKISSRAVDPINLLIIMLVHFIITNGIFLSLKSLSLY